MSGDEAYRVAPSFHSVVKPASARRPELEEIVAQLGAMFDSMCSQPDRVDEDADALTE